MADQQRFEEALLLHLHGNYVAINIRVHIAMHIQLHYLIYIFLYLMYAVV